MSGTVGTFEMEEPEQEPAKRDKLAPVFCGGMSGAVVTFETEGGSAVKEAREG